MASTRIPLSPDEIAELAMLQGLVRLGLVTPADQNGGGVGDDAAQIHDNDSEQVAPAPATAEETAELERRRLTLLRNYADKARAESLRKLREERGQQ